MYPVIDSENGLRQIRDLCVHAYKYICLKLQLNEYNNSYNIVVYFLFPSINWG